MNISTLVFFDLETTGLPYEEKNQTKITELAFVAVSAKDIESTSFGSLPVINKLTLLFNPQRKVSLKSEELSGLSNALLAQQPVFKAKIRTINSFLEELPKPICLIAHNGNRFDFKLIQTEYSDANSKLPPDLLCIDSLIGFRKILKDKTIIEYTPNIVKPVYTSSPNSTLDEIITDDEDEWPELNASFEDWKEIDELTLSLSNITCGDENIAKIQINKSKKKSTNKKNNVSTKITQEKVSYSLSDLYRRLLKKEPVNSHRAEVDCIMLLECVIATKSVFLPWANNSVALLSNIKPLTRGKCIYHSKH